jgi:hypothetical protein
MADQIKYEIVKTLGALGEGSKGWKKEVNIIKWNDRPGKIDIRSWAGEEHGKMGKGVTMSKAELKAFIELFKSIDIDTLEIE